VHLCDASHCQRKGSGNFCEDLGLASHYLFFVLLESRKGLGIEDTLSGGALFADKSDI
jgi:hypothetical protein